MLMKKSPSKEDIKKVPIITNMETIIPLTPTFLKAPQSLPIIIPAYPNIGVIMAFILKWPTLDTINAEAGEIGLAIRMDMIDIHRTAETFFKGTT